MAKNLMDFCVQTTVSSLVFTYHSGGLENRVFETKDEGVPSRPWSTHTAAAVQGSEINQ